MRAMECWPIQYLMALGIASQSPGYLPNAEYMPAQITMKRTAAERTGAKRARIQRTASPAAAAGRLPPTTPRPRIAHQTA